MKFSIKDLKKSLMENFISYAVINAFLLHVRFKILHKIYKVI